MQRKSARNPVARQDTCNYFLDFDGSGGFGAGSETNHPMNGWTLPAVDAGVFSPVREWSATFFQVPWRVDAHRDRRCVHVHRRRLDPRNGNMLQSQHPSPLRALRAVQAVAHHSCAPPSPLPLPWTSLHAQHAPSGLPPPRAARPPALSGSPRRHQHTDALCMASVPPVQASRRSSGLPSPSACLREQARPDMSMSSLIHMS